VEVKKLSNERVDKTSFQSFSRPNTKHLMFTLLKSTDLMLYYFEKTINQLRENNHKSFSACLHQLLKCPVFFGI